MFAIMLVTLTIESAMADLHGLEDIRYSFIMVAEMYVALIVPKKNMRQ